MILAIILLTAGINVILGIISYTKNPKSDTNQLLAVLTFLFALWTVTNYFSLNSSTADGTLFWIRAVMFVTAPLGPVLYLFVKAFPHAELKINKILFIFLTILTIIVDFLAFTPFIFSSVSMVNGIHPKPSFGIVLFGILFIGGPIASVIELFRKYKISSGLEKLQLKYLVLGIVVTFGLLIFTNFLFVVLLNYSNLVIFGPIFSLLLVGVIFYAIVRHRLLEIRRVIARSVAYTFIITLLVTIYTLGLFLITHYLIHTTASGQLIVSAILALFVGVTFEPIKNLIENLTDNIFFKGKYDSNTLVLQLTTLLASTVKLKELTQKTLHQLLITIRIDRGAFIIFSKQGNFMILHEGYTRAPRFKKEVINKLSSINRMAISDEEKDMTIKQIMQDLHVIVVLPLAEHERKEGLLLLGEKKSGEIYTEKDIKVLEIFGPEISIAIQTAKSYEEIRRFNATLKEQVDKATKELTIAHRKLQVLDKQKDEFIGVASHELKTPITSIKILAQVLQRKLPKTSDNKYESLLQSIDKQTDRVTQLINDLLNVSNIEAGKLIFNKQAFDFDKMIVKTISEIQHTTDSHKIIKKGKINTKIVGDETRIEQVISNLLTNAIKYSPNANKIIVSTREDNKKVLVSVQDFGAGIHKKDQEKIFEKFYRTEKNTMSGFGLGLYIAAEIIKRHEGEISVKSTIGRGSTFSFMLPITHK